MPSLALANTLYVDWNLEPYIIHSFMIKLYGPTRWWNFELGLMTTKKKTVKFGNHGSMKYRNLDMQCKHIYRSYNHKHANIYAYTNCQSSTEIMTLKKMICRNLEGNLRLVVESPSSPISNNQEAKRSICFWWVLKTLKLSHRTNRTKWQACCCQAKEEKYGFGITSRKRSHVWVFSRKYERTDFGG